MEEMKKHFSENDIKEVELIAKIAMEDINTNELSKKEYINLKEALELMALKDLYNRRYKEVG